MFRSLTFAGQKFHMIQIRENQVRSFIVATVKSVFIQADQISYLVKNNHLMLAGGDHLAPPANAIHHEKINKFPLFCHPDIYRM